MTVNFRSLGVLLFTGILAFGCGDRGLEPGEGFVDVTGGRAWYRIVGSGTETPALLLHGGPGASSAYFEPLAALSDERPVIFYDQLGGGRSDRPDDPSLWTKERFVEELGQFRQALGLDRVHILGHSWGTMLAVDYYLSGATGIESLVLASPALSAPRWIEDADRLRAELPEEVRLVLDEHEEAGTTDSDAYMEATMEFYRRHLCRSEAAWETLGPIFEDLNMQVYGTMWGPSEFFATGNLGDYDRTDRLGEIAVPTLFTAGRFDEATPETTAWYRGLVPGASLAILEKSAHMTMLEEPEAYVAIIREFLNGVENGM